MKRKKEINWLVILLLVMLMLPFLYIVGTLSLPRLVSTSTKTETITGVLYTPNTLEADFVKQRLPPDPSIVAFYLSQEDGPLLVVVANNFSISSLRWRINGKLLDIESVRQSINGMEGSTVTYQRTQYKCLLYSYPCAEDSKLDLVPINVTLNKPQD